MENEIDEFVGSKGVDTFSYINNGIGWCNINGEGYGSDNTDDDCEGTGSGSGEASGYGYISGSGYTLGYNDGESFDFGYGHGTGDGYGHGSVNGKGIRSINNHIIYRIDDIATIIFSVHQNIAKGAIVRSDLTLNPCYIAKGQNKFAHGETAKKAMKALEEKILEELKPEEAIEKFLVAFPNPNKKYPVKSFYSWHHILTGSCEFGRRAFAQSHGIDIQKDKLTVMEFCELTENAYGGKVIKQLKEKYFKSEVEEN